MQLPTFNLAALPRTMRPSAAAVMSILISPHRYSLDISAVSNLEYTACRDYLLFIMKLHKRAVCFIAFPCALHKNEKISRQRKHKAPEDSTRHDCHGCLHSHITMWSLAVFLLGLPHAIQTVTHLYSASGWSWLNYYNVTIFPPHCKSGLDCAWHWALAWLRHGLNESKCKNVDKSHFKCMEFTFKTNPR